jgi:hypothetical protein
MQPALRLDSEVAEGPTILLALVVPFTVLPEKSE